MVVISTGAFIVQVYVSRLRRPLDTLDLEELPIRVSVPGPPVLWLSCEGQIDVWEMFFRQFFLERHS